MQHEYFFWIFFGDRDFFMGWDNSTKSNLYFYAPTVKTKNSPLHDAVFQFWYGA